MPLYSVKVPVDALYVQGKIRFIALDLGFTSTESQELAIVASELASNILKYGVHGELLAEALPPPEPGLKIVATDHGPPFKNLASALKDGWDDDGPIDPCRLMKRQGIGGGLGAISRFTDSLQVDPRPGGKAIVVVRYLKRRSRS